MGANWLMEGRERLPPLLMLFFEGLLLFPGASSSSWVTAVHLLVGWERDREIDDDAMALLSLSPPPPPTGMSTTTSGSRQSVYV